MFLTQSEFNSTCSFKIIIFFISFCVARFFYGVLIIISIEEFLTGFPPKMYTGIPSPNSNTAAHYYHARFPVSRAFGGEPRVLVLVSEVAAALAVYHRVALVAEHEILFLLGRVRLVDLPGQIDHCEYN